MQPSRLNCELTDPRTRGTCAARPHYRSETDIFSTCHLQHAGRYHTSRYRGRLRRSIASPGALLSSPPPLQHDSTVFRHEKRIHPTRAARRAHCLRPSAFQRARQPTGAGHDVWRSPEGRFHPHHRTSARRGGHLNVRRPPQDHSRAAAVPSGGNPHLRRSKRLARHHQGGQPPL